MIGFELVCIQCGSPFIGKTGRARLCSGACRTAHWRAKTPRSPYHVCMICGKEFIPGGNRSWLCSDECRRIRKNQRNKEQQAKGNMRKSQRKRYAENPALVLAEEKAWREANPERHAANRRAQYLRNPKKVMDRTRLRRATKKQIPSALVSREVVYWLRDGMCPYCWLKINPLSSWHLAHIWPLGYQDEKGNILGVDTLDNLAPAHPGCNSSVKRKLADDPTNKKLQDPRFLYLSSIAKILILKGKHGSSNLS